LIFSVKLWIECEGNRREKNKVLGGMT
jgi:hypothetical protein